MTSLLEIKRKYSNKIDCLDLELIIAHAIRKSREFVLTYPEFSINKKIEKKIDSLAIRRTKHEPLAYILGEKEFLKIKFKVDENVLIPRPETEQLVELAIKEIQSEKTKKFLPRKKNNLIVDVGTGSGNVIISLAKQLKDNTSENFYFFGIDISKKALAIAKQNAKNNMLDGKIKFIRGNLLSFFIKNFKFKIENYKMTIAANLPYLSPEIYQSCSPDIKKYEPKSALISRKEGLCHYEKLLREIKILSDKRQLKFSIFLEISPEQKNKIAKLVGKYFSKSKIIFHKDLSGRWRICELEISN